MAWLLNNASSGSAYIQAPPVSIGATVGDYIEIKANANAGNPSNNYRPFGDYTLGANANIVQMRPTYLQVIAGNTNMAFTTGYTQPAVGSDFVLRLVKASSTQWQAILNGVSLGLQSASTAFLLSAIFKMNASTSEAFRGKVYYVEISTNGGTSPTRYYDPSASGGTGTTLPDTVGGQNGTQAGTWPSDDSEWVFYSSGSNTESTIAYDIGAIDYAISSTAAEPNATSTIAYDIGSIAFAVSSTVSAPATTAAISYDIGAINFATSASVGASSAVAFDIGSVDYSISASATSNASAAIAFDIGEINFDLSALVVSNISTTISYDIGSIDFAVYCTIPTNEPERSLMTKDNVFWRNSIFFKSGRT